MTEFRCGTCRFLDFSVEVEPIYWCHRYPESLMLSEFHSKLNNEVLVDTGLDHWCGEHQPDTEGRLRQKWKQVEALKEKVERDRQEGEQRKKQERREASRPAWLDDDGTSSDAFGRNRATVERVYETRIDCIPVPG